jgi:hypothetical protein
MLRLDISVVQDRATFFGLHMIYYSRGPYFDRDRLWSVVRQARI